MAAIPVLQQAQRMRLQYINANFKTETDKIRAVFIGRHQISAMMYQECLT
jgi:hypothetical protein